MTVNIDYTIEEIADLLNAELLSGGNNSRVRYLSLDSRKISESSATLFWAIKTSGRDAGDFIKELYDRGVRNFVTQKKINKKQLPDANIIIVDDALKALQSFAVSHRKKFKDIQIIGITGSNGKTIVKEWLAQILTPWFSVVRSPRSFNSQVGVPLSVLQINETHRIGIFEAGISEPGEMERLEKIIQPETGVFTNIGSAHDEGFKNKEQKISEKLKLFRHSKQMVFPEGQNEIRTIINKTDFLGNTRIYGWSKNDGMFSIINIVKGENSSDIRIRYQKETYRFTIPFIDDASVENAISCFCTIIIAGFFRPEMLDSFTHLHAISMRLELKPGQQRCSIINDSYSNDLQSLEVAADFLHRQSRKESSVILSDLLQSGLAREELYHLVADILHKNRVNRLIGIGKEISESAGLFGSISHSAFFSNTEDFIRHISAFNFHDETILVKGARKFSFEKIIGLLEEQPHETILSVNLTNLAYNIRVYRSLLKPETKIMAMVKAFAYGTGSQQISSLLEYVKADYLSVAYTQEGITLREAGIDLPIMVMNAEHGSFDKLIRYRLEPEIFSVGILKSFSCFLSEENLLNYPIHLKIDTGMHRLGFTETEVETLIEELGKSKTVRVMSVFSHFSSSENPADDDFTIKQFSIFKRVCEKLRSAIPYPFLRHISNSGAIFRFPEFQMDMVRLGKGMYGITDVPQIAGRLKIVNELSTTISQIKRIKSGDVVGYQNKRIEDDKLIATMKIGYADGFRRIFGNGRGKVMVRGKLAPTVGNVCMDMTMIDISGIKGVREGDKVIIFGESLPIQKMAKWADTIELEVFTGISSRVRRVYFEES